MPPHGFTNPAPKTESAREARKSFFCELCQKGYSRMNEFEAHESSYDHQHKKRLKEMKQMQRDPLASSKARRAERRADEKSGLITIKPVKLDGPVAAPSASSGGEGGGTTGFRKKGGFKSAFTSVDDDGGTGEKAAALGGGPDKDRESETGDRMKGAGRGEESDTDEEGYEMYKPEFPTD